MALESKVFTYQAELVWRGGRVAAVTSDERPELTIASPPEFSGGSSDRWSPEHLYLASLESCTMISFLAHCAHNDLDVEEYTSDATGSLQRRADDQRYAFTHVAMVVRARMAGGQAEAARGLTGKAERDCFISASTNATVETDWQITG